jgi:hypothetical protein
MDIKHFKKIFTQVAMKHGFDSEFTGWFRESANCILALQLQHSAHGRQFDLNLKGYLKVKLESKSARTKEMVNQMSGHYFLRPPQALKTSLDMDQPLTDFERENQLNDLFVKFVDPVSSAMLVPSGLLRLADDGRIFLPPAVRQSLDTLVMKDQVQQ